MTWSFPGRFANIVLHLGGMHLLMSFICSVGTLMADSGLSELLFSVFAGVPKMLKGKIFPQNMRALRMVAEEVLWSVFDAY